MPNHQITRRDLVSAAIGGGVALALGELGPDVTSDDELIETSFVI
jgi:hypothetical protein